MHSQKIIPFPAPVGVLMKRVSLHEFYEIGSAVHPLLELQDDASVGDVFIPLADTKAMMRVLLGSPAYQMPVARNACQALWRAVSAVIDDDLSKVDFKRTLTWGEAYAIRESAKKVETILAAELPTLNTYVVDQKGAYSTADLVERADIMFPEEVRNRLSVSALNEWKQAGKAFVFDLPTAAGFHMMRATEAVIRQYYEVVVGKAPKQKQRNWGVYTKVLLTKGADSKVIAAIDQMRELHRNPLIHPEQTLSEADVLIIAGIAQSTITAMVADIKAREKPSLAIVPSAAASSTSASA